MPLLISKTVAVVQIAGSKNVLLLYFCSICIVYNMKATAWLVIVCTLKPHHLKLVPRVISGWSTIRYPSDRSPCSFKSKTHHWELTWLAADPPWSPHAVTLTTAASTFPDTESMCAAGAERFSPSPTAQELISEELWCAKYCSTSGIMWTPLSQPRLI